jgi:hypothetical protein
LKTRWPDILPKCNRIRETLHGRYDDLKSGKVKPIPGNKIEAPFREKSAAVRSKSGS